MWTIFCAIKRSWSQHFVEQFSALIILFMTYTALLFVALSLTNIQNMFDVWGKVNQMTVYLQPNISNEDKTKIVEFLKSKPIVDSLVEVTSEESAKSFESKFSQLTSQKIDSGSVAKFFPSYVKLNLNQTLAYKSGLGVLDELVVNIQEEFKLVKNVSYGKSWLSRYVSVLSAVQFIGWFLIVSFLVASVIVSSSIIKSILYSRKDEIEIMEFIGADDMSIYLPQIINIVLLSVFSFVCGLSVNFLIFQQVKGMNGGVLSTETLSQMTFITPVLTSSLFFLATVSVFIYSVITIFNLLPRRKKALLIKEVIH